MLGPVPVHWKYTANSALWILGISCVGKARSIKQVKYIITQDVLSSRHKNGARKQKGKCWKGYFK